MAGMTAGGRSSQFPFALIQHFQNYMFIPRNRFDIKLIEIPWICLPDNLWITWVWLWGCLFLQPMLEQLSLSGTGLSSITGSVKGLHVSFSGPETQGQMLIRKGEAYPEIAYAVYDLLIRVISKWILNAVSKGYTNKVLLVGGVSSSRILRQGLQERLSKRNRSIRLYYADPKLSKDNAVGTALLGLQAYQNQHIK